MNPNQSHKIPLLSNIEIIPIFDSINLQIAGERECNEIFEEQKRQEEKKVEEEEKEKIKQKEEQKLAEKEKVGEKKVEKEQEGIAQQLKNHSSAREPGSFDITDEEQMEKTCPCCYFPLTKAPIKLACDRNELSFFGLGFSLYFEIICWMCVTLVIVFLVSGVYRTVNIFLNCSSSYSKRCYGYMGITYSTEIGDEVIFNSLWLDLTSVLVLIFSMVLLKDRIKYLTRNSKDSLVKLAHFTFMIKNIPPETNENKIKSALNLIYPKFEEEKIKKFCSTYKVGEFITIDKKKELLEVQKEILEKKLISLPGGPEREQVERSINDLEKNIDNHKKDLERIANESKSSVGSRVFVTVNSRASCKKILDSSYVSPLKQFWFNFLSVLGIKKKVTHLIEPFIQRAPEPMDIIWENLEIPPKSLLLRRCFTYSMSLLLISVGLYGILEISKIKQLNSAESINSFTGILLSLLCSLIIVLINFLLKLLIELFSAFEMHSCTTEQEIGVAIKLSLTQFINVALAPFFLFLLYKEANSPKLLLQNIFFIFMVNLFIEPITNFFDIVYFYTLIKRAWIKRNVEKHDYKEVKVFFEGPSPQMAHKYAGITKNILTAAFFAPIFPIGLVLCLLTLFITYWLDKYLLLRRCAFPVNISEDLPCSLLNLLQLTPLLYSLGSIAYNNEMLEQNSYNLTNYIVLGISLFFFFLSISFDLSFNRLLCKKYKEAQDEQNCEIDKSELNNNANVTRVEDNRDKDFKNSDYEYLNLFYYADYDRVNPLTNRKAKEDWKKQLEEKKISEDSKKVLLDSLNEPKRSTLDNIPMHKSQYFLDILGYFEKPGSNLTKGAALKHSCLLFTNLAARKELNQKRKNESLLNSAQEQICINSPFIIIKE